MVKPKLILVLGDQLSPEIAALRKADKERDLVIMAEVVEEMTYVPHHPKKLVLFLTAMRKFAASLSKDGWTVVYSRFDDENNTGTISGELNRHAIEYGAVEVIATTPGEWRLIEELNSLPFKIHQLTDDRFITSPEEFSNWVEGRKELRMEWFYRHVRQKTGLLMDGDQPVGGKWNYDNENRKPAPKTARPPRQPLFEPDEVKEEVLGSIAAKFPKSYCSLEQFNFATDRQQALQVFESFVTDALPNFGKYQDAMISGKPWLWHAIISPYLNLGLLTPLEVCMRVEQEWKTGHIPLNSAEGFIRQIIGWREYVRGIYFLKGPEYTSLNFLDNNRNLPELFWGAKSKMNCLTETVGQTLEHSYAHHIQRLMVIGNFALLAGLEPKQVHEWYLSVYADAVEWVEAPNTIGMSQFADGGVIASKPYISSGNYISRMSDYCEKCSYNVKTKTGDNACPFNLLYWHFIERNRSHFENNNRMAVIYQNWNKRDTDQKQLILAEADAWLKKLDRGELV